MGINFDSSDTDRKVRTSVLNNFAQAQKSRVVSGCTTTEDSPTAMSIEVGTGTYIENDVEVEITSALTGTITAADASYPRIDLIALDDNAGSPRLTVLAGTPASAPKTPVYTADDYVIVASVYVAALVTTIVNADITDLRIIGQPALNSSSSPTFAGLTVDTDTLYIDSVNHRVGINELSPDELLHVTGGNIKIESGDLILG